MAIILKVNWVEKSDEPSPSQRIRRIGGISNQIHWRHTQAQAIDSIEHGMFAYYIDKDSQALKLDVGVTAEGKYLTVNGADSTQLLLDLPDFPTRAIGEIDRRTQI